MKALFYLILATIGLMAWVWLVGAWLELDWRWWNVYDAEHRVLAMVVFLLPTVVYVVVRQALD